MFFNTKTSRIWNFQVVKKTGQPYLNNKCPDVLFEMRKHQQRKMLTALHMNLISNLPQMQCRLGQIKTYYIGFGDFPLRLGVLAYMTGNIFIKSAIRWIIGDLGITGVSTLIIKSVSNIFFFNTEKLMLRWIWIVRKIALSIIFLFQYR